MKNNRRSIRKDKRAFTGLEAAIVLTAFVVVAAVFSYVVLNAGFFTTQKAKEVVHTGVESATSSLELAGEVIGIDSNGDSMMEAVKIYLQLTAGEHPVDLNNTVLTYMDEDREEQLTPTYTSIPTGTGEWGYLGTGDNALLEYQESAGLIVSLPAALSTEKTFTIEVKPTKGATLEITRRTPGGIEAYMILVEIEGSERKNERK